MRLLSRLLVLVAVLLMPFGMTPASASMAHEQMTAGMPMGHCPDQTPSHDGKSGFAECTMACAAALPAIDRQADEQHLIAHEPLQPLAVQRLQGLHPETATPPPRSA
jgi:hypothetical protein